MEYKEKIRNLYNKVKFSALLEDSYIAKKLEEAFPELKEESEDERIRKALIWGFKHLPEEAFAGISINDVIAWLKKKGDTNNINLGEFAKGVLRGAATNLITWIDYNAAEGNMCLSNIECNDIGDALVSGDWDKIYAYMKKKLEKQGELKEHNICDTCDEQYSCISPCPVKLLDKQGEQKPAVEIKTPEESLGIDSKTYNKIVDECIYGKQKSYASETMNEKGDFDNGFTRMMEKEQKPAWSEEDEIKLGESISLIQSNNTGTFYYEKNELTSFLKSLKDRVQPQPKWSEEDERMFKSALWHVKNSCGNGGKNSGEFEVYNWLKSLKERVQPKTELIQLDENILEATIAFVEQNNHFDYWRGINKHTVLSALYSLRPQNKWKPSDEQMDALHYVTNFDYGGHKGTLVSLYEQLKKLRGE